MGAVFNIGHLKIDILFCAFVWLVLYQKSINFLLFAPTIFHPIDPFAIVRAPGVSPSGIRSIIPISGACFMQLCSVKSNLAITTL